MAKVNLDLNLIDYVQFMIPHPSSSYLRDYVTLELGNGLLNDQVPKGYLFFRTFSKQVVVAPDGELLQGRVRDESDWSCSIERILRAS